ncbi:hypothetical protein [Aquipseudomonas campi]
MQKIIELHIHALWKNSMKKLLVLSTLFFLMLALLAALLWMGGVAGAVTGGGRGTDEIRYLLTLSTVLIGLAGISGLTALTLPGKNRPTVKKRTDHD